MLRVLIYCVLFALVPVVAWFTARRVSRLERRLVGAVMVIVPTGLIVFVMVMTSHGKTRTAVLSSDDGLDPPAASWTLGSLLHLDNGPVTDGTTVQPRDDPSVATSPAATEAHPSALGGHPDAGSETRPDTTKPLVPRIGPIVASVPVGTIQPPNVTAPPIILPPPVAPTTRPPKPPTPSPPGQPTPEPPVTEPTTPVTTPPHTTPPHTTTQPPPPTSDAPAPTTEPPADPPTTKPVREPETTEASDPATSGATVTVSTDSSSRDATVSVTL
jgi:hypothetical protein